MVNLIWPSIKGIRIHGALGMSGIIPSPRLTLSGFVSNVTESTSSLRPVEPFGLLPSLDHT